MSFSSSRRTVPLLLLGVALLAAALSIPTLKTASASPPVSNGGTTTILVSFKTGASDKAVAALLASQATPQVDAIPALGLRVLRVPNGKDATAFAANFAKNPLVKFAEPNSIVMPDAIPNDPNYASAWHLAKIEAPLAWDSAKATGVLAAVCDTGVEATHPDLAPILRADLGWNAVSNSSDWSPIAGHGTLVSGALAAATNNATGVAGVAWGANVIPVRISNTTDGSAFVSDAVKCIQYAADNGARVINLSYRMASYASIDTAGAYAKQRGALTFVAAGNDGIDPGWTDYPNFLAVAATKWDDARASFSNFGTYIDLAAPGDSIWTSKVGAGYGVASGTSLASPVAAGVGALIFGANPGLSASQAEAILLQSATDLGTAGEDGIFGAGRVNARQAVALATGAPAPTPTSTPTATPTTPAASTPTPAPTSPPPPTPTATPTSAPAPSLKTDTFTGKVGGKGQPTSRTHSFTVTADGPLTVKLSWGGKAKLSYTVYDASGAAVTTGTSNGISQTIAGSPAGTYTIVVRLISGQASYTATVTHY